jgi:hypothetical protein
LIKPKPVQEVYDLCPIPWLNPCIIYI